MQLQGALNRAWEVKPDPRQGGVKQFIMKRLLSLGFVMGVAFLLIVSLVVSALLSALSTKVALPQAALSTVDLGLSFIIMAVLFAAIYRFLPDAEIEWRDVWVGALVTALLFVVGKFAIGFYLGRSAPGDAYGAASALAIILVWVYYAGMIVLFGAEFTQAWAERRGGLIRPEKGAVKIEQREVVTDAR
jgi:membrane protein